MTGTVATLFDPFPTEEASLPPLQGSEKQIEWAEVVRAGKLKKCRLHLRQWSQLITRYEDAGRDDLAERERVGYRAAMDILAVIEAQASCRFWLDHRGNDAQELLTLAPAKPGNSFAEQG